MRKYLSTILLLLAASAVAGAACVFAEFCKSDYNITESTSLGNSVTVQNSIVHQSSGNVSGTVVFNTKAKTIKFTNRKVKYDQADLVIKTIGHSCIISGKGILSNDGGEVSFQVIEDMRNGNINMIVKWPDFSAVRFLAELKERTTL